MTHQVRGPMGLHRTAGGHSLEEKKLTIAPGLGLCPFDVWSLSAVVIPRNHGRMPFPSPGLQMPDDRLVLYFQTTGKQKFTTARNGAVRQENLVQNQATIQFG